LELKYKIFIQNAISKVPNNRLTQPSALIAASTLEHVKYLFDDNESSQLEDMFSNLLAASLDIETKDTVHPVFGSVETFV